MSVGNIRNMGKIYGILLDIILISAVFFVIDNFIFSHEIEVVKYLACIIINIMFLWMLNSYSNLCAYTIQKRRLPLTLMVSLILSAVVFFVFLMVSNHQAVESMIEAALIFVCCYSVLLISRSLLLRKIISIMNAQTLLILHADNCSAKFLNKLMNDAVDYKAVKTYNITMKSYEETEWEIRQADSILIVGKLGDSSDKVILLAKQLSKPLAIVPTIENVCFAGCDVANIGDTPILELKSDRVKIVDKALKRILDIAASLTGLIVLSPVFALIAIAIKIDSKGPVFYK